jgi:hypothetical protein
MFSESVSRFLSSENELLCFGLVFRKLTRLSEEPGSNFGSDFDYPCWFSYVLLISPCRRVPQHCLQYVLSLPVLFKQQPLLVFDTKYEGDSNENLKSAIKI